MREENREPQQPVIKLDGTFGTGHDAHVTIIVADPVLGRRERMYEFPMGLVDMPSLNKLLEFNLILGYRIERIMPEEK